MILIYFNKFHIKEENFEKSDYKNIINLYVLKDGSLRVEQNIKLVGLEKSKLNLEVVFDGDLVDSNLEINKDKHQDIIQKYEKIEKDNIKLHIILFGTLVITSIGTAIGTTVKIWNRRNIGKIHCSERDKVKLHYGKILLLILGLVLIFYTIIKII